MKKVNNYLLTIVISLLFVTLLLLVKILFSGVKGFSWGSVSDWLTLICNAIMACSALYAAWLAKNWLKPNLQQQGISKIVLFLQNELTSITSRESKYNNADFVISKIEYIYESVNFLPGFKEKIYNDALGHIQKNMHSQESNDTKLNDLQKFNDKMAEFSWYGYKLAEDKHTIIKEIYELKGKIHSTHIKILEQVRIFSNKELMDKYTMCDKKNEIEVLDLILDIIKKLKDYSSVHDSDYDKLCKKYDCLIGRSTLVTDFFILRG